MTSLEAISLVRENLKKKISRTNDYIRYVEDSKTLVEKNNKTMKFILESDLSPQ